MRSHRRSAHYAAFAVLFIISNLWHVVHADTLNLSAIFVKCDGLIGKSPKSVFAVLGAPTEAVKSPDGRGSYTLVWKYKDPKPGGPYNIAHSVTMNFNSTKALDYVSYDGFTGFAGNVGVFTDAPDGGPGGKNYPGYEVLAGILRIAQPGHIQFGYDKRQFTGSPITKNPTDTVGYQVVLKATTKNENFVYTACGVNATIPLCSTPEFDPQTSVYKYIVKPNPNFVLNYRSSYEFSPGILVLVPLPTKGGISPLAGSTYGSPYMHYQIATDKLLPWLQDETLKFKHCLSPAMSTPPLNTC